VQAISTSVRRATSADAAALAELVNAAFAIEEFFVDGDRTNAAELERMMQAGEFLVLDHGPREGHTGGLAAAVYVERGGYFGMLSVQPALQGMGLGKRLVRIAEALCEATGCATMSIRIINLREELARWYRSLGYRETGIAPYTHRALKRPAHFVEMQRTLAAA
jgi:ribosomal protein S18 acetylase RimI-like enzyme